MRRSGIVCFIDLDDLGGEIENRHTYRAALAKSAHIALIARTEVGVWERARTSGWRHFQQTHVDIVKTSDKCNAVISCLSDLDDLGEIENIQSRICRPFSL